jgi:hypothetical protein
MVDSGTIMAFMAILIEFENGISGFRENSDQIEEFG